MENINDLNRALFNRLEAFDNDKMSEEELNAEIQKTDAVVKISDAILRNAALALRAQEHFSEYGIDKNISIPFLGITDNALEKNQELRGEIKTYGKIK